MDGIGDGERTAHGRQSSTESGVAALPSHPPVSARRRHHAWFLALVLRSPVMPVPDTPGPAPTPEPRQQLRALIGGYRISRRFTSRLRSAFPDLLAEGPREIGELARASGAHAASLRRVLRALAGVGVLEKVGSDRFALAPLGAALRKGVPGSVRSSVLFLLNESHWRPWGHLLHSVRTGEIAFDHVHGTGLFDTLRPTPRCRPCSTKAWPATRRLMRVSWPGPTTSRA